MRFTKTFLFLTLLGGVDSIAQNGPGSDSYLQLQYQQESGPRVTVKGESFSFSEFTLDGQALTWPLDVTTEPVPPTPSRNEVGLRLSANVLDAKGRPCQVRVTAQAAAITFELKGLPPGQSVNVACKLTTKTPTLGMHARIAEKFEPPILNMAIGDPDVVYNLAYEPGGDRLYVFVPAASAWLGKRNADGSRIVRWHSNVSADGDVNGALIQIENEYAASTWHLPRQALMGWASHPPRCGWRSFAAYKKEPNAASLSAEAEQVREKLYDYGARYFQIDDGWQLTPESRPAASPWKVNPKSFPRGLGAMFAKVKSLSLTPSLWIVPQASCAEDGTPGILTNFKGEPASGGSIAKHLWDGATPEGRAEQRKLIDGFVKDGVERFFFDSQPEFLFVYKQNLKLNETVVDGERKYRESLTDLRSVAGAGGTVAIGGSGVIRGEVPPLTSDTAGIADSIQIFDDMRDKNWTYEKGAAAISLGARVQGWAIDADPGIVRVGEAVTFEIARSWATLAALTGEQFFISERMATLSEDRLEILRRTMGGPAVRTVHAPMDCTTPRRIRVWRELDGEPALVSAHFSFDVKEKPVSMETEGSLVSEMARAEKFDYWSNRFLGRGVIECEEYLPNVDRKGCLVVVARKPRNVPMVLATSRHVTQGIGELTDEKFEATTNTLTATSALLAGDPYEVQVVAPTAAWIVKEATAEDVDCTFSQVGRFVRIAMKAAAARPVRWRVKFDNTGQEAPVYPAEITSLKASNGGGIAIRLDWSDEKCRTGVFLVKRNGVLLGSSTIPSFLDTGVDLRYGATYAYEVIPVDDLGAPGKSSQIEYRHEQPLRTPMAQLGYQSRRAHGTAIIENFTVLLTEFSVNKKIHRTGLGVTTPTYFDVPLRGASGVLLGRFAIDDLAGEYGSAEVIVKIDEKFAVKSPVLKGAGAVYDFRVPIFPGSKILTFEISGTTDGSDNDIVDIISPEIHLPRPR